MPKFAYPILSCVHVFLIFLGLYTELFAVEPLSTMISRDSSVQWLGLVYFLRKNSHWCLSQLVFDNLTVYTVYHLWTVFCILVNAARVQQETDTPGTTHQALSPRGTALPKVGQRKQEVTEGEIGDCYC